MAGAPGLDLETWETTHRMKAYSAGPLVAGRTCLSRRCLLALTTRRNAHGRNNPENEALWLGHISKNV